MKTKKAFFSAATGLLCLIGLVVLSVALTRSMEGLAPAAELITPSRGVWRHHSTNRADLATKLQLAIKAAGLEPVELEIDHSDVPHLKSKSDSSLYFAQGFITAYYRLWQMDFLSRITSGRVAELLGEKAVPIDRFFRRMRVPAAARASSELMMADPVTSVPISAYTRGVNARIGQIDVSSLPNEYRLFGLLPEPWTDDRTAYLLKYMTWELTGYMYDFKMTASKTKLSQEIFNLLFPVAAKVPATILGSGGKTSFDSSPSDHAGTRRDLHASAHPMLNLRQPHPPEEVQPEPNNGSNNWAVPANRMANRRALLADDLHLGYTLPSLWFPIQLMSPTMNVYGASLPGAPGVIVGFTESMGWAVTNGSDDVLDWYSLRYRDARRQEYLFEDSWRPVVTREETIQIAGGKSEVIKTRETHVGPIVFDEGDERGIIEIPAGVAVQWVGYTPSNELRSFLLLNHGVQSSDCLAALQTYVAPSQNFICADRKGKIVYKHAGVFPDRKGGDGRTVTEASTSADLWQGTLPADQNPTLETTTELIVTANQAPFNGDSLPKFGWFYTAPFRALQIRARIDAKKQWQPEQMIEVQGDTSSWLAENFKRIILREAAASPLKDALQKTVCADDASKPEESLGAMLGKWSGEHDSRNTAAPLMHRWMKTLEEKTWTDLIGPATSTYWPSGWRFFELMDKEPNSIFWDNAATPATENLNMRLVESYKAACESLRDKFGSGLPAWSAYQTTSIRHTGRIPGLGRVVQAGGVAEAIFANKGEHGPTWKMIVTFEDTPRAWTMIPGGQSGDPSSAEYDNTLDAWSRGEMRPVKFNMRETR